ncbi:N-acetylmuramoyl-L-alanine amidase, partial [Akkermansiaceae bacterium]|nr:N-acetylmuramoyl-L-alanine amidase [Akkermansiaceae bacterium]
MNPRYITIHSTQNFGVGAGAQTHARLLQRGGLKSTHNSLGYLTWHYTVDAYSIYQSLPLNEQGQHADYE